MLGDVVVLTRRSFDNGAAQTAPNTLSARVDPSVEVDTRRLRRRVIDLSGPALVEMVLVSFVGVVDMIMVGRIGPAAIAAVGLTNQPMFIAMAVFQALNVGTTALVARFIGARDPAEASRTAQQSLLITVILGLILSVLSYWASPWVIAAMGAEPDTLPLGISYFQIVSLGIAFMAVSLCVASVLRGVGDTKTPMKVNVVANLVNCVGNYILIYGKLGFPAYGVVGAAAATTISRVVAAVLMLGSVLRKDSMIKLGPIREFRLRLDLIKRVVNIGIPSAVEQFVFRVGQLVYVRIVAGLGTVVFAAHQIGMNILSLSFMPGQAFSMAATTLVGQALGARKPEAAEKCALETRRLGMIISGAMTVVLFFFGERIARLYTADLEVARRTAMVLRIIGLVQPAQSTQFILSGALRGAGDTKWPLYSSLVGIWGVRVVFGYTFTRLLNLGLFGAWLAMALDQLARSVVIFTRFRSGGWKTARV